jgi:hypothetical protein
MKLDINISVIDFKRNHFDRNALNFFCMEHGIGYEALTKPEVEKNIIKFLKARKA